jgi:hypothetical protein
MRAQGYARFEEYWQQAPPDLVHLKDNIESRAMRRQKYELSALVLQELKSAEAELAQARDAKRPMQVS